MESVAIRSNYTSTENSTNTSFGSSAGKGDKIEIGSEKVLGSQQGIRQEKEEGNTSEYSVEEDDDRYDEMGEYPFERELS